MGGLVSRRSFVKRSAAVVGATAGGGLLAGQAQARRARNDLSPRRERSYRALVAAVAGAGADAAYVDHMTAEFRAWYRSSMPHVRASVDATIDSLDRRGFGRLRRRHRLEMLRTPAASATAAQAVALARLPLAATGDRRCAPGAV
jgi:hypothetical protein